MQQAYAVLDLSKADPSTDWGSLGFKPFTPMPLTWFESQHATEAIHLGVIFTSPFEAECEARGLNAGMAS